MEEMMMPFLTLTDLVLENIFKRLDIGSHLALSYTCKSLQYRANRHLYSHDRCGALTSHQTALLEWSLSVNQANARFLRVYSVANVERLRSLWSNNILHLRKLKIAPGAYDNTVSDRAWAELVSSVCPDTRIHELTFHNSAAYREIRSGCVLSAAFAFRGLVRVEFDLMYQPDDIGLLQLLTRLNCPQVKHITLHLSDTDWHVLPGNNLPSLQSLHYHFLPEVNCLRNIMHSSSWTFMKALLGRNVFLRLEKFASTDVVLSFFRPVHLFSGAEDLQMALEWVIRGDYHFQTTIDRVQSYDMDIRDLSQFPRNYTLRLAHDIPQPHGFRISIYGSDASTSAHSTSVVDVLPRTTSHLDVFVMENVDSGFLPKLVRSLYNLKSLVVNVYGSRPPISADNISPSHSCTRAQYAMHITAIDDFTEQFSYDLAFSPDKDVVHWRHNGWLFVIKDSYGDMSEQFRICTWADDLRMEVSGWFQLNPRLKSIEFRLWAGLPWSFILNSADFPVA